MKKLLLASVAAAALLAAPTFANAQGMKEGGGGKADAPAKAESPAQTGGSAMEPKGSGSERTGGDKAMPHAAQPNDRASGRTETNERMGSKSDSKASESKSGEKPSGSAASGSGSNSKSNAANEKTDDTHMKSDSSRSGSARSESSKSDSSKSEMSKDSAKPSGSAAKSSETPQGSAATKPADRNSKSASLAPPAEKRTQIVSAFKQEKVTAVTNVNFKVEVGVRVPTTVHYYPVPRRIVEIYPEWEGYEFILVNGEYIIISPDTHEIVFILQA